MDVWIDFTTVMSETVHWKLVSVEKAELVATRAGGLFRE